MGYAHMYKCKSCGKSGEMYLSIGMLYPYVCAQAKQSAVNGEMGTEWQKFVVNHPNGSFDCENVVFACSCGGWCVGPKLDYYVANADNQELPSYFCSDENYEGLVKRSQHSCPKCRKNMHQITDEEIPFLHCPSCNGELDFSQESIMWD